MLESLFAAVALLAGGIAVAWQRQHTLPRHDAPALLLLAEQGAVAYHRPQDVPSPATLKSLELIAGGVRLNTHTADVFVVLWRETVLVQPLTASDDGQVTLQLHTQAAQRWRVLTLTLHRHEMMSLMNALKRSVPRNRWAQIGDLPPAWVNARLAQQTLEGVVTKGAEVGIYLVGQWLVILRDDIVHAKLTLKAIRRVLAMERIQKQREGLVRLHSMNETVLFICKEYQALAEEIALRAGCPLEVIARHDKEDKL